MVRDIPPELRKTLADALSDSWPQLSEALAEIPLPTYVLDRTGAVRWENASALKLFGDRRGAHFTSLLAPESQTVARSKFTRKVLGAERTTTYPVVVVSASGEHVAAEIESVALGDGDHICGVFGVLAVEPAAAPQASVQLTARQLEVLRLLAAGRSTAAIAAELHVATDTVRNHVRGILRTLGVHSRLQAVVKGRELGLVDM